MKTKIISLFTIVVLSCCYFSFENFGEIKEFLDLVPNAKHVLHIQVAGKDQETQWTKGFTDYQVQSVVLKDFKGSYSDTVISFSHRVDGPSIEETRSRQLKIGQEYIVLVSDKYQEITKFEVEGGEMKHISKKVFLLIDSYKGVQPYSYALSDSVLSILK